MRIIANSLPKSGTHLLTRLLDLLGLYESDLHLSASLTDMYSRNPVRNIVKYCKLQSFKLGSSPTINVDLDNPKRSISKTYLKRILIGVPDNSYSQAHVPYNSPLRELLYEMNYKMLYIIRDPRDVLISFINQQLQDKRYPFHSIFNNISELDRIKIVMNGYLFNNGRKFASLEERYAKSLPWFNDPMVKAIRFEDLIGNKGNGDDQNQDRMIRSVLKYLNIELADNKIGDLTNNLFYRNAETFNKGKIGTWNENLSDSSIIYIENQIRGSKISEFMNILGYDGI